MKAYGTKFFSTNYVNRLRIFRMVSTGPQYASRGQPGNRQLMPGLAERALRIGYWEVYVYYSFLFSGIASMCQSCLFYLKHWAGP